eukprot:COSAG01_NODE_3935_length_5518_cov_3.286769_10_plen_67_part_00
MRWAALRVLGQDEDERGVCWAAVAAGSSTGVGAPSAPAARPTSTAAATAVRTTMGAGEWALLGERN